MIMDPAESRTKNDFAGEDQQQFTRPDPTFTPSARDDGDRQSHKIGHQRHIDTADHPRRLHCIWSLWSLEIMYSQYKF
jgi:hypothetical protein